MNTTLCTSPASESALRVFDAPDGAFQDDFNRRSFMFSHGLAGHPLFELPRLLSIAKSNLQRKSRGVLWNSHDLTADSDKEERDQAIEAIANIETSGSRVLLWDLQSYPEFGALLNEVTSAIEKAVGSPLRKEITWKDITVFLHSPHALTPYHIDHECTFLFQIRGHRTVRLWDQSDRSVVTESELEDYYLGHRGAAAYKPENDTKAQVYELEPGKGLHHPSTAPHLFTNGETYSVAMGIHLCLRQLDLAARVYQFNGLSRQLGMRPSPPGRSQWRDQLKMRTIGVFSKRNPKTKYELIRSGARRIRYPLKVVQSLKKKLLG